MANTERQYISDLLDNDDFIEWILHPTEASDSYWNDMTDKDEQLKKIVHQLKHLIQGIRVDEQHLSPESKQLLWKKIEQRSILRKRSRVNDILRYASIGVAASLILFFSVRFFSRLSDRNDAIDYKAIVEQTAIDETSGNVLLVLSKEKVLDIAEKNAELVYDKQGKVNIPTSPELENTSTSSNLNQLIVPYGKTSNLVLSDGTKIWINSGSRIIYPSVFAKKQREIYVEGEVYLEVVKNEQQPFVVKTDKIEVNVYGTSFNVQAYKGEESQSVVLVTGSVSVSDKTQQPAVKLLPNQQYEYDVFSRQFHVEKVDIYDYICWKYGFFHFKSEKLSTVLERLEKYYNTDIIYNEDQAKSILVSGKLDMKESLTDVLNTIALTAHFQFEKKDQKIIITI